MLRREAGGHSQRHNMSVTHEEAPKEGRASTKELHCKKQSPSTSKVSMANGMRSRRHTIMVILLLRFALLCSFLSVDLSYALSQIFQ